MLDVTLKLFNCRKECRSCIIARSGATPVPAPINKTGVFRNDKSMLSSIFVLDAERTCKGRPWNDPGCIQSRL